MSPECRGMNDLFGGAYPDPPAPEPVPDPYAGLSAGRRLAARQRDGITAGIHPLTKGALLPGEETCGTCRHRIVVGWHDKTWPKCDHPSTPPATHGPATDVRAWWPACTRWESADA